MSVMKSNFAVLLSSASSRITKNYRISLAVQWKKIIIHPSPSVAFLPLQSKG